GPGPPARHALGDAGRAQHAGVAELDQHGSRRPLLVATGDLDLTEGLVASAICSNHAASLRPPIEPPARSRREVVMNLADKPFTINGLPLPPLLVHAVVVLLPLAAVGSIVIAVYPRWRRRFWLPVLVLAVLGIGAVPITQQAGEALYD